MKLAIVGLGTMGKYIGLNLAKSEELVVANDVVEKAFPEFIEKGINATVDISKVSEADCIFLSLPNTQIVRSVVNDLKPHLRKGQIIVDLSTIKYNATLEISRDLEEIGVDFIDAPVSGMEERAKDGTLTVMCGGNRENFEKIEKYLNYIGNKILYMGEIGAGQLTKLINQLLFDINAAALAEILPMSVKMGLNSEKVGQVVNSGTGRSYASEFFIPHILQNSFDNGYSMSNAYKDLVSAAELGASLGIPMPVLAAATSTYQQALLKGLGDNDKGAMIKVFEDLLKVEFRVKEQENV
jgi:3-hydroxyisobutyrate dehydrogenase-like beta-hydroxyacid dehydrogenase